MSIRISPCVRPICCEPVDSTHPDTQGFCKYTGPPPLESKHPGEVLRTRSIHYHLGGIPTPFEAMQLLYRSTSQTGEPTVNVTSVIQPPIQPDKTKVLSYQSFYDSLNQKDEPSYAIAGGDPLPALPELINSVELAVFAPFLAEGYTVIVPDVEGQKADFAAGPEYGMNTLDSIRAAFSKKSTLGFPDNAKVAMLGYSGGALATEWAAEVAPAYAPEVNKRLIGAAMGGLLVHPAHNLHYVDGSRNWGGVMLMALVGITRAFENEEIQDISQRQRREALRQHAGQVDRRRPRPLPGSDVERTGQSQIPESREHSALRPVCQRPDHGYRRYADDPAVHRPGRLRGTRGHASNKKGIGVGDGVMIAGDVRTLASGYRKHTQVWYEQYDESSRHLESLLLAAELDRLDQAALRRRTATAEFIDQAGQRPRPDSGSAGTPTRPVLIGESSRRIRFSDN